MVVTIVEHKEVGGITTLKDVMALVDKKKGVSIREIAESFDITTEKACRVVISLIDRGLLLPMETSYLARPIGGLPASLSGNGGNKTEWTKANAKVILEFIEKTPDVAVSMNDLVKGIPDFSRNVLRNAVAYLVDEELIIKRESSRGGAYGRRPMIYGLSEDAAGAREELFDEKKVKRTPKPKAPKGVVEFPLVDKGGQVKKRKPKRPIVNFHGEDE